MPLGYVGAVILKQGVFMVLKSKCCFYTLFKVKNVIKNILAVFLDLGTNFKI